MVLEDIKYQLDQFYSFDNIKLSFEVLNKQGFIYFSNGKILNAVLGSKRDIDVFKELKNIDAHINIQVSIGEPASEITLNQYFDEILEIIDENVKETQADLNSRQEDSEIIKADEESNPAVVVRISESLSVIPGVESIIAVKENGEILYSKGVDDAEFESADAMFLYNQSKELGDILNFKSLKSTVCEANNYKKIIINNKNILYSMKISSEAQALKTQMEVAKLLKDA
ncbi:MAG: hypothetical protein M0Z86_00915 [Deltaproteobacteria bacterium]|nr:hypothetical protein [Deltaproteobacteria bacterium]